mmetsp:Transcript_14831/g.41987  ORF Transcript_14831/g.41987 Transcript_14831/m.41987 type:complete len:96 (+) Transcript_14831:700-987(+)
MDWSPNPLMLFRAGGATLDDGGPTGRPTSSNPSRHVSSSTRRSRGLCFLYMADKWFLCILKGQVDACYVWLPTNFHDHGFFITFRGSCDLGNLVR